jgi:hypothetical protein
MKAFLLFFSLFLVSVAPTVSAQTDPYPVFRNPYVFPNPASAGEEVDLVLLWNGCGGWEDPPTVQRSGSVVTVSLLYNSFCAVPTVSAEFFFSLGTFRGGDYEVIYQSQNVFGGWEPNAPEHIFFVVTPPASIPVLSPLVLLLLALSTLVCGLARLTIRSSGLPMSVCAKISTSAAAA